MRVAADALEKVSQSLHAPFLRLSLPGSQRKRLWREKVYELADLLFYQDLS
jgi:hypothetical protein